MKLRIALGSVGVAAMGLGAVLLASPDVREPLYVLGWLVVATLLHDALLVPLVLAIGALLPLSLRRSARGALLTAAALTAVALPVLLRPGRPANPSVLPLDYGRNLLVALGTLAAVTVVWYAVRRHPRRPPR